MAIKLEIEVLGEILRVRDTIVTMAWSQLYPGRDFRSQGESFSYDELRGMGNGTHSLKASKPKK